MAESGSLTAAVYAEEQVDDMAGMYLTFSSEELVYGLSIRNVTEIVALPSITPVPDLPDFVRGVVNLRGRVIPVVDVRMRFGLPYRDYHERTCLIILSTSDMNVGLIVDGVNEVIRIPDEQIEAPPRLGSDGSRFVSGVGKVGDEVRVLLDLSQLLSETVRAVTA